MTDRDWIALTLWGEARGELTEGRLAVASVLRNRLKSGRWGTTYQAVCTAPKQFSCWNADDPNLPVLKDKIAEIAGNGEPAFDRTLLECYWIADGLLSGALLPQVGSATHYYSDTLSKPPAWASTGHLVEHIGHHLFFAAVA